MDTYSILDKKPSQAAPGIASSSSAFSGPASTAAGAAAAPAKAREALRFPGEDGGKSLSEMAQRDLDATLQLLVERAQYITGASGAAIALREGENMVCCASAGESAPELGAHLQIDSGLSAESVRTRKVLHCDDAENDPRVNRESCQTFGIASVVVMPLLRGEEVYGVFELLASRPRAFEERDFVALQRLAEMIQTAVEHAEAARRAEEFGGESETAIAGAVNAETGETIPPQPPGTENAFPPEKQFAPDNNFALEVTNPAPMPAASASPGAPPAVGRILEAEIIGSTIFEPEIAGAEPRPATAPSSIAPLAFGKVRSCEGCGFPISEGRRLCLDCEAANPSAAQDVEATLSFGQPTESDPSWMRSHVYLVATVLLVVATIAVVVWRF